MVTTLRDARLNRPCLPKTDSTLRVLFVSDSNGLSYAVRHWEHTPVLLEQYLNRLFVDRNVEVFNVSLGGWGFHHYASVIERTLDAVEPDLVLLFACSNDSEIHSLSGSPEVQAKKQWDDEATLVRYLFATGARLAQRLASIDVMLFTVATSDNPPIPQMNKHLANLAADHNWVFATSRGLFGNLPPQRLAATETDGHPSAYVHHVCCTQICRVLSETIYRDESTNHLDIAAVFTPILNRLADVPVESCGFLQELVRVHDMAAQKIQQLDRALWNEDAPRNAEQLRVLRALLCQLINYQIHVLGEISHSIGHETEAMQKSGLIPLELFNSRLVTVEAMDLVTEEVIKQDVASLKLFDGGPKGAPAEVPQLLTGVQEKLIQVRNVLSSLERRETPFAFSVPAGSSISKETLDSLQRVLAKINACRSDRLFRLQYRREEIRDLMHRSVQIGLRLLKRCQTVLTTNMTRETVVAIAQPIAALNSFLNDLSGLSNNNLPSQECAGYHGESYWRDSDSASFKDAMHWRFEVDITVDSVTALGIWVESVVPFGHFMDYQFVGPAKKRYVFSFPFTYQFALKIAPSAVDCTIGNPILTVEPIGLRLPLSEWSNIGGAYRTRDFIKIRREDLVIPGGQT